MGRGDVGQVRVRVTDMFRGKEPRRLRVWLGCVIASGDGGRTCRRQGWHGGRPVVAVQGLAHHKDGRNLTCTVGGNTQFGTVRFPVDQSASGLQGQGPCRSWVVIF